MASHFAADFSLPSIAITVLTTIVLFLHLRQAINSLSVARERKNFLVLVFGTFLFGWLGTAITIALLGLYHVSAEFVSPLVPLAFIVHMAIFWHLLKKSDTFKSIADKLSQKVLILLQVFRVLGYSFLVLLEQNKLPALFAIPSGYGDIIIGATAPIVAFLYLKNKEKFRKLAIAWNALGIIDLFMAISLGTILAFPQPFQIFPATPTTEAMTIYPMVIIPVFAVPLGIMLHILSLRLLLKEKK